MPIGDYAVGNADVSGLDATFARQLDQFLSESPGIQLYSAFRSPAKQAKLWENALQKYGSADVARKWVAPPGRSFHGRGQAGDLRFPNQAAIDWAHENAPRYGLTFPLSNENWHIEPMGARGQQPPGGGPAAPVSVASSTLAGDVGVDGPRALPGTSQQLASAGDTSFSPGGAAAGPRFTQDHMSMDAFLSDYMNGINPLRTIVMGKLRSLLA